MRFAVDTSALVAIVLSEAEADDFERRLIIGEPVTSGHVLIEATMVLSGRGVDSAPQQLQILIEQSSLQVIDFDAPMTRAAQQAFLDFGKGRHSARLNFGDCMSYAVAKSLKIPLLWKGNDFDLTDIERAA